MKKIQTKKKFKTIFLAILILFLEQKMLITFFYKWSLWTNYIPTFIMKKSIGTRSLKNSTSKL